MIIAVDFDKTYSADPPAWDLVVTGLRSRGHDVIMLTARHNSASPEMAELYKKFNAVFCTRGRPKKAFADRMGVKVDVWIDDNPGSIL